MPWTPTFKISGNLFGHFRWHVGYQTIRIVSRVVHWFYLWQITHHLKYIINACFIFLFMHVYFYTFHLSYVANDIKLIIKPIFHLSCIHNRLRNPNTAIWSWFRIHHTVFPSIFNIVDLIIAISSNMALVSTRVATSFKCQEVFHWRLSLHYLNVRTAFWLLFHRNFSWFLFWTNKDCSPGCCWNGHLSLLHLLTTVTKSRAHIRWLSYDRPWILPTFSHGL